MEMRAHAPGTFCWASLSTKDVRAATAFYREIFGWSVSADGLAKREGKPVAAIRPRPEGAPEFTVFVATPDLDAVVARARELGATIAAGPEDGPTARTAVVRDPSGAELGLWQAGTHAGTALWNEPGALCWTELATDDTRSAAKLYRELFGWGTTTVLLGPVAYTEFLIGEQPVAGMQPITEAWGPVAAHWLPFFAVDDCDGTAAHAQALGALVKLPPTELPRMGRFAVLEDPQGAAFGVFHLGAAA